MTRAVGIAGALGAVLGCHGAAVTPAPAPEPAPVATRDVQLHLPDDAYAVLGVDLVQLRASPAWGVARDFLADQLILAASCPEVLDTARQVTVALRDHEHDAGSRFVIVRGIERAQLAACLHAKPGAALRSESPRPPFDVPPGDRRPRACRAFDVDVHDLAHCGVVPASVSVDLETAQVRLAATPPDAAAAACASALEVVDRARARRDELGWACVSRHHTRSDADAFTTATELDASTVLLDGVELVHFVDDHTLVVIAGDPYIRPEAKGLQADLAALLARPASPHWSEAPHARLDRHRAIWLAATPAALVGEREREVMPTLVSGTLDLHDGVTAELRIAGAGAYQVLSVAPYAEKLVADPELKGVTLAASCAEPAPTGPRVRACSDALEHRIALSARRHPEGMLADALQVEGAVTVCVEAPWSADYLACLNAATSEGAVEQCDDHLSEAQHTAYFSGPICGSRDVRLRIDLPFLSLESLKLAQVTGTTARPDCRAATIFPAPDLAVGPRVVDGKSSPAARVCFGSAATGMTTCWTVDLGAAPPGHDAARWELDRDLDLGRTLPCTGPFTLTAPDFAWASAGASCNFQWDAPLTGSRRPPVTVAVQPGAKRVDICRSATPADCKHLKPSAALDGISINTRGTLAALVVGAAGAESIETWDLATGTRLSKFAAGTTAVKPCATAQLLDDTLLLAATGCATSATSAGVAIPDLGDPGARLVTTTGKAIAAVGGTGFDAIIATPIPLGGTRWAFAARTGDVVVIQDVVTGAIAKRVPAGAPVATGTVSVASDGADQLVLAYGGSGPRAGSITSVDLGTGTLASFGLPACPAGGSPTSP